MQAEDYNRRGKEMVDYITQYLVSIRERKVIPDVTPDYMRQLIPDSAPVESEDWEVIFNDIERVIMPGVVHWQSPHMHAYFPGLTSWPSMLGDMLAIAIDCIGFTWASSPASTELEMNMMDWLCKAIGLPNFFLHYHPDSRGGGVLQTTVSESTLTALLAARKDKILQLKAELDQEVDDSVINARLVAYASDQAHSSVEKAGLISLVKIRFLPTDDQFSLRGDTLKQAILEDRRNGLVPFMLVATLGSTAVCAFDKLSELGPICHQEGLWLHVDAAYAGTAYICPELRWSLEGVHLAHSFVFNPSKWMLVHFDCTAFWVKDKYKLQQTFSVDPVYLQHENSQIATDFMRWQIPLSRGFRSLKLWFVMRSFGMKKLQDHIRHGIEMAKLLESQIRSDPRFEIPAERHLGLVVFCLKEGNALTQELLKAINRTGKIYVIPAEINNKRIIRFNIASQFTTADDILRDWDIISKATSTLLKEKQENTDSKAVTVQPKPREDGASGEEDQKRGLESVEQRDATSRLEESQWELRLKKDWNVSRKTQRSLSCSHDVYPGLKSDAAKSHQRAVKTGPAAAVRMTENPPGEEVLKKMTKFHSVPTFCDQLVQCGRQQMCFPTTASQATQENSSLRCMRGSVAPPTTPTEVSSASKLQ